MASVCWHWVLGAGCVTWCNVVPVPDVRAYRKYDGLVQSLGVVVAQHAYDRADQLEIEGRAARGVEHNAHALVHLECELENEDYLTIVHRDREWWVIVSGLGVDGGVGGGRGRGGGGGGGGGEGAMVICSSYSYYLLSYLLIVDWL